MSTETSWPLVVTGLEEFMKRIGLKCERREEEASFSNKLLRYTGEFMAVRVVSDRGIWFIEVANVNAGAGQWYDVAIIRDLLFGSGEDVLSLEKQVDFIECNWLAVSRCFSPPEWQHTSAQLTLLRNERTRRRLPGFFSPPAQIN